MDDAVPSPSLLKLLRSFLGLVLEHGPVKSLRLTATIENTPRLHTALAVLLQPRLVRLGLGPHPVVLVQQTRATLSETWDKLWAPRILCDDPSSLVRSPLSTDLSDFYVKFPKARLWVAGRLHWFEGVTLEKTAEHLGISVTSVERLLAEASLYLIDFWIARHAPNLR